VLCGCSLDECIGCKVLLDDLECCGIIHEFVDIAVLWLSVVHLPQAGISNLHEDLLSESAKWHYTLLISLVARRQIRLARQSVLLCFLNGRHCGVEIRGAQ
jgi:hypothetical protein